MEKDKKESAVDFVHSVDNQKVVTHAMHEGPQPTTVFLFFLNKKEKNMLTQPTLDKLRSMRLTGMADAFSEQLSRPPSELDFETRLATVEGVISYLSLSRDVDQCQHHISLLGWNVMTI